MSVHPTSLVAADAELEGAEVGPFCVVGIDGSGSRLRMAAGGKLRSHVVLYRGTTVGARFHAAHQVIVREATRIGDDVSVGTGTTIEHDVTIGDGVRLHSRCFVPEFSVLETGAWLGPGVILTNARYPNRPDTKDHLRGVVVEEGAVLGAGALVLPGVTIGKGALVGAGAVVVRDVPPGKTVVGNPSRMVG